MPCFHPLDGWRSRHVGRSGKRAVTFNRAEAFVDLPVRVPCGQCVGCRLEYSRQWAMRIMHEAQLHDSSCFVTLTYDDKHLPRGGSLDKKAFPLFMKRLRRNEERAAERERRRPRRFRYFQCGEYGDRNGRPHYHACLFGTDFSADRYHFKNSGSGYALFRSPSLEAAWQLGHCDIGALSFESAAYVARYVVKKVRGTRAKEDYERVDVATGELFELEPEFATMSRRPGIGAEWLEKFGEETYRDDSVIFRGKEMRPPGYYDRKYEEVDSGALAEARAKRRRHVDAGEQTRERLAAREKCAEARLELVRSTREDSV